MEKELNMAIIFMEGDNITETLKQIDHLIFEAINPINGMVILKSKNEIKDIDNELMRCVDNGFILTYYIQIVNKETQYNGFLPVNTFSFLNGKSLIK